MQESLAIKAKDVEYNTRYFSSAVRTGLKYHRCINNMDQLTGISEDIMAQMEEM